MFVQVPPEDSQSDFFIYLYPGRPLEMMDRIGLCADYVFANAIKTIQFPITNLDTTVSGHLASL